jgi:two-component system OmpR family sensor kinase
VVFSVDDDGPALDGEGGGELFERAARGERLIAGRSSLGVAVVKSLVEQHGGRVWSAVASGNSLCFDLPAARA